MKVLEVLGEPMTNGGQEAFVAGILRNLDSLDIEIDCLTPYREIVRNRLSDCGARIYSLGLENPTSSIRTDIARPFRRFLDAHFYDVVHIHSMSISVLAMMAAAADRAGVKKVIVHSHSAGERESLKHSLLRVAGALSMARHVDVYCACSREAARWKFMGECAERALIIKNGVDLDVFRFQREKRKQIREALQLPDSTLVVGHVGRFTYQKNHEFLIEVFAALAAKERDCHLLLIGDGEDRKRIREMAERLGLSDRVTMTGNVDNVSDYMQAMDVFVMPSRFEGLPIVGVEAQATGLPMVLSDAITREIALSDRVSFMSLKDGAPEWAGAIQRYRGCERVSDNAAIRRAGFDEKATARQIGALYKGEMAN